jgi:hypothetical protein
MTELSQIVGDELPRAGKVEASVGCETGGIRPIHADTGQALDPTHLAEIGRDADPQKSESLDPMTDERPSVTRRRCVFSGAAQQQRPPGA